MFLLLNSNMFLPFNFEQVFCMKSCVSTVTYQSNDCNSFSSFIHDPSHITPQYINDALRQLVLFALARNFNKSNTLPWVFFMFFELYKWYQIAQSVSYKHSNYSFVNVFLLLRLSSRRWSLSYRNQSIYLHLKLVFIW